MKKYDHEQMLNLYDQWQVSSESKTEFAVGHGIHPNTFCYWARKFERGDLSSACRQSRGRKAGPISASGFHRIPLEEMPINHRGEIMAAIYYPSGIRLELYSSFQNLNSSYVQLLKTLTE